MNARKLSSSNSSRPCSFRIPAVPTGVANLHEMFLDDQDSWHSLRVMLVDGADAWAQFRYVTVPQMSAVTFFNLIMGVIGSFQVFTANYGMFVGGTGGPERAALFYVLKLWSHAFRYLEMGYASAMAWVLFVIILALTGILFRVLGTRVYYEGLGG